MWESRQETGIIQNKAFVGDKNSKRAKQPKIRKQAGTKDKTKARGNNTDQQGGRLGQHDT